MGVGKTSEQTQTQQVDPNLAKESHALLNLFKTVGGQGYQPNKNVRIADMSPREKAAIAMSDSAGLAFGMPAMATGGSAPTVQRSASGIMGFSPKADYNKAVRRTNKGYKNALTDFYEGLSKKRDYKKMDTGGGGGKK